MSKTNITRGSKLIKIKKDRSELYSVLIILLLLSINVVLILLSRDLQKREEVKITNEQQLRQLEQMAMQITKDESGYQFVSDEECKKAFDGIRASFLPEDKNLDRKLIEKMSDNGFNINPVFERAGLQEDDYKINGRNIDLFNISPEYFMPYFCHGYERGINHE